MRTIAQRLKELWPLDGDSDGPSYLVHLAEEDSSFLKSLNGRFHGVLADRSKERLSRSSTTGTECTGSTITKRRMRFILRPRPRQFWPFARS